MGINVRTILPLLLFYCFAGSSAQAVHDVVTYTSKSSEELPCIFASTDTVLWTEQRDDGSAINLFVYDVANGLVQKQTDDSKYDNFNYSTEEKGRFNLVIKNIEQGDGGRYLCNPITSAIVTFDVTVEVLPESIYINCTESNVCMPSAGKETVPEITCVCSATGVNSSQFGIQWDRVDINSTSSTAYGSSSITSEITLQPPNGTSGISCLSTGYRSQIPERLISYNYTFSPPVCTLTSECPSDGTSASLICSCSKGSPSMVHGYSFYDSQMILMSKQFDSALPMNSDKNETFYCTGCNGVLHDQFVSHALNCNQAKGFTWWIFIIIGIGVLLLLLVVAAIFLVKKRRKKPKCSILHAKRDVEGGHIQVERMNLLNKNGDKQNIQEVKGSGNTTPTQSGGPAPKEHKKITIPTPSADPASKQHKKPDNKSTSAGSGGVGPGQSADNNTRTNGGERTTTPTPGGGPASKADTEPDDKSISAGSSGVGPGQFAAKDSLEYGVVNKRREVTGHQNNAGNENIEKKKPPVVPKKKVENNMKSKQTETGKAEEREVTRHQNNAGNENIEKKKPPVEPKTKGENNRKSKQTEIGKAEEREVTRHQNNAGNENIEKKKPPVEPKTKGENNHNQALLTTERTQGDGRADTDTQGMNENIKDRPSRKRFSLLPFY